MFSPALQRASASLGRSPGRDHVFRFSYGLFVKGSNSHCKRLTNASSSASGKARLT